MDDPKLNRTDKIDRIDKNRADPIAFRFGFSFMFFLFSVLGRFGSVRPKTTKNTPKLNQTNMTDTKLNRTEHIRFGFGSCVSVDFQVGSVKNNFFACSLINTNYNK